jgi:hypothetical protein
MKEDLMGWTCSADWVCVKNRQYLVDNIKEENARET